MNKTCIFIGMTLCGWIGWWLGKHIGLFTAYLLGSIGSLAGVYLGWKINKNYLE